MRPARRRSPRGDGRAFCSSSPADRGSRRWRHAASAAGPGDRAGRRSSYSSRPLEPGQQRRRRQHLHPAAASSIASGSPSSRRQTSANCRRVLLGQGEVGANGLGAGDEEAQPPRRGLTSARLAPVLGRASGDTGRRARPERATAPGWWPEPGRPGTRRAGRQPAQLRSRGDARSCRGATAAGGAGAQRQGLGERAGRPTRYPERTGDGRQHQRWVGQWREVDEGDTIGEGVGDVLGDGQGQPRLAHPAGAGQGEQRDGLVQERRHAR